MPLSGDEGRGREPCVLAIDVGTTVVKAAIYSTSGPVDAAHANLRLESLHPTWAEMDMDELWIRVRDTIRELTSGHHAVHIGVVVVGAQGDGCWLVDAQGRPVRKGITWLDGRASDTVSRWQATGLDQEIFALTGSVPYPGMAAPILCWLADNEAQAIRDAAQMLYCKDWVRLRLTGELATDPTEGSRLATKVGTIQGNGDLMAMLDLQRCAPLMPKVLPSDAIAGTVSSQAATETGLEPGVPVLAGLLDVVASTLGSGVIDCGTAASILGTASIHGLLVGDARTPPLGVGFTVPYLLPSTWLRILSPTAGTINLDWFLRQWWVGSHPATAGVQAWDEIEQAVMSIPPGAEGVTYHPYISPGGERAPFVESSAKAMFSGLGLNHSRAHLLRAVYEGLAFSARDCYSWFPALNGAVRLSGGMARSRIWPQILADVLANPVEVPGGDEGGVRGSAMLGLTALSLFPTLQASADSLVTVERIYQPDLGHKAAYDLAFSNYKSVCEAMRPVWSRI